MCVPRQYTKIFSHETERIGDHLWHFVLLLAGGIKFILRKIKQNNHGIRDFHWWQRCRWLFFLRGNQCVWLCVCFRLWGVTILFSFTSCFIIHLLGFLSQSLGERKKYAFSFLFLPCKWLLLLGSWKKKRNSQRLPCVLRNILLLYRCSVWHLLYS